MREGIILREGGFPLSSHYLLIARGRSFDIAPSTLAYELVFTVQAVFRHPSF